MTFIEKVSYFENSGEINPLFLCINQKKPLYSRKFFNQQQMLKSLKNKNLCESKIAEVFGTRCRNRTGTSCDTRV